jgi:transcriptional regulator with XRE-family HTH domain
MKTMGDRLRRYREAKDMTQLDVEKAIEASSPGIVSRWENGKAVPSVHYLRRLKKIFGVTIDELVGEE